MLLSPSFSLGRPSCPVRPLWRNSNAHSPLNRKHLTSYAPSLDGATTQPPSTNNLVYQVDILAPPTQWALTRRAIEVSAAGLQFMAYRAAESWDSVVMGTSGGEARTAQALQALLTRLGPTFVKLAQTMSMRPDLVGDVYAQSLAKLQDQVPPFPNAVALAILEEELGRPAGEVFEYLSPDPVASASLGQVYRGVLLPQYGSRSVAVKIQRPGASESIALDIFLLRQLLGVVQRAAGITRDLRVLADEIGIALRGECDFRNEVANSEVFAKAHAALQFITTPKAVPELCSRRVLLSEWVDGRSPSQLLVSGTPGEVLSMVRMGIQCSLTQLLVTGCMHGDPHSGNLLLENDGKLCYLDFGLIVRVTDRHRQAMMAALVHLGLGEWARLVNDLENMDLLKSGTDKESLAKELEKEFSAVLSSGTSETGALATQLPLLSLQTSSLSFSTLAGVLFRVAFKFRFMLPSYFPLVIRAVASLEGVALTVDPNFKLVAAGMPVVLNQLLSDRRPAAQELLRELLLVPGGALRTDETTRQILQVWLSAAQQAARAEAIGQGSEPQAAAAGEVTATAAAVDVTSLLLDRRNVPLRRTIAMSNPAATLAEMPSEMRADLLKVLTEALSTGDMSAAASELLDGSAKARVKRKRLWMLFRASVPKVMRSPPKSIFQLLTFTVAVAAAVFAVMFKKLFRKAMAAMRRLFSSNTTKPRNEPKPA